MVNQGKVDRVLREAIAVLVEELGRAGAADVLAKAAAQLRGVSEQPRRATRAGTEQKGRRRAGRRLD